MKDRRPMPSRKNIRLPRESYSRKNDIFAVTICCYKKLNYLNNELLSDAIAETLGNGSFNGYARLLAYCLMHNHVHLLLQVTDKNLIDAIAHWKSYTTHLFRITGEPGSLWQRSFYDHGVRSKDDLVNTALYIIQNPVRSGRPDRTRYSWCNFPESEHHS